MTGGDPCKNPCKSSQLSIYSKRGGGIICASGDRASLLLITNRSVLLNKRYQWGDFAPSRGLSVAG
jgi:hypothetical protein